MSVTEIRPAADADAAQWLLRSDVDWWDLVRYGPPGFDVYVRIALAHDVGADAGNRSGEALVDAVRAALAALGSYTATPSKAYAAIWEGWTSMAPPPQAPRVEIPNRAMLLFTGPVEALRDAPAVAWYGSAAGIYQDPHLVWPEDRAWCLACEVDEEIEFTVGCSGGASQALARALPGAVRRVRYGEPAPLYRDQVQPDPLIGQIHVFGLDGVPGPGQVSHLICGDLSHVCCGITSVVITSAVIEVLKPC